MDPLEKPAPDQVLIDQALNRMWAKFLPHLEERIDVLASANAALAAGKLTTGQRAAANTAAHNLAGVLGTFGLTKGTILAREAEILYSGEPETDPEAAAQLGRIADQLRVLIRNRKSEAAGYTLEK